MDKEIQRWKAEQAALYLEMVMNMGKRIKSLNAVINEQREISDGVKGVDYARTVVKVSRSDDAMINNVQTLQDLIAEKQRRKQEYEREALAASRAIERIEQEECKAALEMHYLGGKTWEQCASELGYSKGGILKIRRRALCEFFEVMPPTRVQKIPPAI